MTAKLQTYHARTLIEIAYLDLHEGLVKEGIENTKKAKQIFESIQDTKGTCQTLQLLGRLQIIGANNADAQIFLTKSGTRCLSNIVSQNASVPKSCKHVRSENTNGKWRQ